MDETWEIEIHVDGDEWIAYWKDFATKALAEFYRDALNANGGPFAGVEKRIVRVTRTVEV